LAGHDAPHIVQINYINHCYMAKVSLVGLGGGQPHHSTSAIIHNGPEKSRI